MTHVMVDLETWGITPGSDLRSIGACVFDPETGHVAERNSVGTFYQAVDNSEMDFWNRRKYPLRRDPKTVQWWNDQSAEAQAAFASPVDLLDGLRLFSEWFATVRGTHIWAHGSHFDVPILEAAYGAVYLSAPWHYRAPRDTRTCFDLAGIKDHSAHLAAHNTGTCHHALDDALCQAKAVCAAYSIIRNWDDGK